MSRSLALVGLLVLASGCSALRPTTSQPSQDALHELRTASARHEVEIERLRREVARLQLALDRAEAARAAVSVVATPAPRPQTPSSVESADLDIPVRPVAVPEPAATEVNAVDSEVPAAAQAIYDQGYTLYHEGRYLEAETSFQRFLTGWGVSPLADNALFWIGASRLARGEIDTALAAFTEVTTRFPTENKVADALLKIAEIAERSGDREGARVAYGRLVGDHAESAAAAVARERLARP